MSTSDVESGTDLPSSSDSALPNQGRHTGRVVSRNGVREFLVVEHTTNVRKNSKISAIWHHSGERRRLDDHSTAMATQCERVFSAARRTLTPERNALGMKVMRMPTVVVEEWGGLGHANSASYDASSCGRGPIRNCIGRGQRVKRRK
jgi:hypothetical protein